MNQTLEIELQLPLQWHPREAGAAPPDNQAAFMLINSLAANATGRSDDDAEPGELQRIEHKLDLVIQLLIPLLHEKRTLPDTHPTRLCASHIRWQQAPAPQPGQSVSLDLFLEPRVPYPVTLDAYVETVDAGWTHARFERLSDEDADALARWIFRYHRRQIAEQRQDR